MENTLKKTLFSLQDIEYKKFHCRLVPNLSPDTIIGVRTPELRTLAKKLANDTEFSMDTFFQHLPHTYYEENNLHAFLIESIPEYERVIYELDRFLPFVDNWATCDMMRPKVFRRHLPELYLKIEEWLCSGGTYTIRFGIEALMNFYLDHAFCVEHLERLTQVKEEDYYIKMMLAWYFATALVKQYDTTLRYIEERRLEPWTHRKAIQKAIESKRITKEQKDYLRSLK